MKNITNDLFAISDQLDWTRTFVSSKVEEVEDEIKELYPDIPEKIMKKLREIRQVMEDPTLDEEGQEIAV